MNKKEYKKITEEMKANIMMYTYKAQDTERVHEEEIEVIEYQNVIEILKKYRKKNKKKKEKNKKLLRRIKGMLDRDTPKRPDKNPYARGEMYRICPVCGETALAKGQNVFCNRCGQRINWSKERW